MRILSNDYLTNLPAASHAASGGPAGFARTFSSYLAAHGHAWIGVVHQHKQKDETAVRKTATAHNAEYYSFTRQKNHSSTFLQSTKAIDPRVWFSVQIEALRKLIRRVQPDLLFLNGFSLYAWELLEAARLEEIPIVIQHAGILQVEVEQYKDMFPAPARKAMLQMEREIVEAASAQVFLNEFSHDAFCARVANVPPEQAVFIPLPYNEQFITKEAPSSIKQRKGGPTVIGSVARWDRIKNHQAILALAQEAKRQGLDWSFRCVTKIPDTPVKRQFKKRYAKTIEVVAPMPPADLSRFYASSDILILPSHFDVSPTVVMEAALLNRGTLISPTVGWVSEYQACGLNDWIIDFTHPAEVVTRIHTLLARTSIKRFQTSIKKHHAPSTVFAAYLRLFSSVI
ncbi:MAG: glycosyltransferase family 4 protein [Patescibacteria group bacterium]